MSSNLTLSFEDKELHIVDRDGQPWFVLADVCRALGIKSPAQVAQRLDDDEHSMLNIESRRTRSQIIISEPGLYKTILRSDAAVTKGSFAHRYLRWVTHEVLPSIRTYGFYDPARLAEIETIALTGPHHDAGISKTHHQRFLEEIARYEANNSFTFADATKGIFKNNSLRTMLQHETGILKELEKAEVCRDLLSMGVDVRYIYSGSCELTEDERRLRDMFRAAPDDRRLELIRRAHTLALPEE